ncbi:uncharacterized protein FYW47_008236 [Aplochiton taeniatus]
MPVEVIQASCNGFKSERTKKHRPHSPQAAMFSHQAKIISEQHRTYAWVAELIQVFIAISITVSFLVMGSAMKHTMDGLVSSVWTARLAWMSAAWERSLPQNFQPTCTPKSVANGVVSFLVFGIIFIVSACDPRGFVVMLDKVVSFSLNTEVGLFVFVMLRASRSERFQHLVVPLPVERTMFSLSWVLPAYFLFAVAYDILESLAELAQSLPYPQYRLPSAHLPPAANVSLI